MWWWSRMASPSDWYVFPPSLPPSLPPSHNQRQGLRCSRRHAWPHPPTGMSSLPPSLPPFLLRDSPILQSNPSLPPSLFLSSMVCAFVSLCHVFAVVIPPPFHFHTSLPSLLPFLPQSNEWCAMDDASCELIGFQKRHTKKLTFPPSLPSLPPSGQRMV